MNKNNLQLAKLFFTRVPKEELIKDCEEYFKEAEKQHKKEEFFAFYFPAITGAIAIFYCVFMIVWAILHF